MTEDLRERIVGPARMAYDNLSNWHQADVLQFLRDNPSRVLYDRAEVVDAWLIWNGMLNHTDQITALVRAAYREVPQ
jgi:hypothetical protein